jgi:gluconokinase
VTRVLALDVGTSSVRARLYDETGAHVSGVEAQTKYGPAEAEVDADALAAVGRTALAEAQREAGGVFDAVSVSCFWHSLLALDAAGRPLTPVLTWRDMRAVAEAEELAAELDSAAVHARTGCVLHPSFWPAKLLWLRRREPEAFARAARFVSFPEFLLGGEETSPSIASGTGLLGLDGRWDAELLAALELDESRLPVVSDDVLAFGDGACANVGVGAVEPDRAALSIGTSGALRVVRTSREPRPGLFLYRVDSARLLEGGAVSDGGNLFAWLTQTLRLEDARGLADEPPDGHGLTFLALLGGERSPGWNPRARGAVAGLTFDTTPRRLAQAALEGVAFRFAEIAELIEGVREIVATGGALEESPDWTQILADVLGRELRASAVEESSARGAAVLALERLGERPDTAPLGEAYEPRSERAQAYRTARERQRRLYEFVTQS